MPTKRRGIQVDKFRNIIYIPHLILETLLNFQLLPTPNFDFQFLHSFKEAFYAGYGCPVIRQLTQIISQPASSVGSACRLRNTICL